MRASARSSVVAGLAAATFLLGTGAAEAAGATKEVAFKNAFGNCDIGATVGASTESFAIINFPSNGTVSATIKLKKLDPDTTYQVRLVQTSSSNSTIRRAQADGPRRAARRPAGPLRFQCAAMMAMPCGPSSRRIWNIRGRSGWPAG